MSSIGLSTMHDVMGSMSSGGPEIYAESQSRGRATGRTGYSQRSDPSGGPFRSDQGGVRSPQITLPQGPSVHLPEEERPRGRAALRIRARRRSVQVDLAHELSTRKLHANVVDTPFDGLEHSLGDSTNATPVTRDRTLKGEIDPSVVG